MKKILPKLVVVFCTFLTGCYNSPLQNPGDWSMDAAPRENLASQVADKTELFNGHGDNSSNGIAASAAVDTALSGGTAAGLQKPPKELSFTTN